VGRQPNCRLTLEKHSLAIVIEDVLKTVDKLPSMRSQMELAGSGPDYAALWALGEIFSDSLDFDRWHDRIIDLAIFVRDNSSYNNAQEIASQLLTKQRPLS